MIEALGQMCVFFLLKSDHPSIAEKVNPETIFFTGCDGIKCRRICKPGDILSMVVKTSRVRHPLACFSGEISVNDKRTAQAAEIKLAFDYYPVLDVSKDDPNNPVDVDKDVSLSSSSQTSSVSST